MIAGGAGKERLALCLEQAVIDDDQREAGKRRRLQQAGECGAVGQAHANALACAAALFLQPCMGRTSARQQPWPQY